ncbi:MAG: hypothetical protein II033_06515, partial [Clostridia bacterium]|nr:hypothetical protein [Clostridia bacterium]
RRVHRKMALASLKEHESPCRLTAEERAAVDSLWHPIGYKGNDEVPQNSNGSKGQDKAFVRAFND